MRFMVTKNSVGAVVFIEFLNRLIHNAEKPIYLIVDGHPAHKAKKVTEFVESVREHLQIVLPAWLFARAQSRRAGME